MNNSAYAVYLKKNKNHAGCNNSIISIMGSSDSVVMKFIKPTGNEEIDTSDISSVSLTWSMLARQIRAYSAEEHSENVDAKSASVSPLSVEDFIRKNFRVMMEMCLDYIEYDCNDEDDVKIVEEFKELISCFEE